MTPIVAVLVTLAAAAPQKTAFEEVVAAERAFAAASLKDGYHAAFAAAFMPDGVVFDPVPTSAQAKHAGKPRAEATLAWAPAWAAVSPAGDLGFTSGPWEYRATGEGAPAPATGWFFTAWRKQPDGSWKVEADLGVTAKLDDTAPADVMNALATPPPPGNRPAGAAYVRVQVGHQEHLLQRDGKKGIGAAVTAVVDPEIRVYRDGKLPATGEEARELLAADARAADCAFARITGSATGDLGYVYGTCRPVGGGEDAKAFGFLRVWRRQADGTWRVFVDVTP